MVMKNITLEALEKERQHWKAVKADIEKEYTKRLNEVEESIKEIERLQELQKKLKALKR